jgi:type IV pilus assembly protein PilC
VLIFIAIAVLNLMLLFVLPRFAGLFKNLDSPLPPTTKMLMAMSGFLHDRWYVVIGVVAAAVFVGMFWWKNLGGRSLVAAALLKLPKIDKLIRSLMTARLARLLGTLLESHVPLMDSLQLTREAAVHAHYVKLIERAEEVVERGQPISAVLCETDLIVPSVQEAIRNAEQSGDLGGPLVQMADFLDEENEIVVKTMTGLLEPAILVVMGALVALMAISMFLPLFDLVSAAHGGG